MKDTKGGMFIDTWGNHVTNFEARQFQENSISHLWLNIFESMLKRPARYSPLVTTYLCEGHEVANEDDYIKSNLDVLLKEKMGIGCDSNSNTIFPSSLWNPRASRNKLYERYLKSWPNIKRGNGGKDTYFMRMIAYGNNKTSNQEFGESSSVNQLDHVIKTYLTGNHRPTALQISIFDPNKDHSNSRQKGFPCMQQLAFVVTNQKDLHINAFYGHQYVVDRLYGNLLGLFKLGRFVAHELDLSLSKINCIASIGTLSSHRFRKRDNLNPLLESINSSKRGECNEIN